MDKFDSIIGDHDDLGTGFRQILAALMVALCAVMGQGCGERQGQVTAGSEQTINRLVEEKAELRAQRDGLAKQFEAEKTLCSKQGSEIEDLKEKIARVTAEKESLEKRISTITSDEEKSFATCMNMLRLEQTEEAITGLFAHLQRYPTGERAKDCTDKLKQLEPTMRKIFHDRIATGQISAEGWANFVQGKTNDLVSEMIGKPDQVRAAEDKNGAKISVVVVGKSWILLTESGAPKLVTKLSIAEWKALLNWQPTEFVDAILGPPQKKPDFYGWRFYVGRSTDAEAMSVRIHIDSVSDVRPH